MPVKAVKLFLKLLCAKGILSKFEYEKLDNSIQIGRGFKPVETALEELIERVNGI